MQRDLLSKATIVAATTVSNLYMVIRIVITSVLMNAKKN